MALAERLREFRGAIVSRWVQRVLASYGDDAAVAFARQKDPFANPVGHHLREAAAAIFEALLETTPETELEQIRPYLYGLVKMRAVQEFSASEAVGFVFQLKEAIRDQLAEAAHQPPLAAELAELERRIDQVALAAFDAFVECREQVYELRINEVKRNVSWVMEKMNAQREGQS